MDAAQKKDMNHLFWNCGVLWRIGAVQDCTILQDGAEPASLLS